MMTAKQSQTLRLSDLSARKPTRFALGPEAEERAALAADLGILGIEALSFRGALTPRGRTDWTLEADLAARVTQACVVTTEPVTTAIAEKVTRTYVADLPEVEGDEVEMPEDDSIEALPATLDLAGVMAEALALSLPLYPRAPGAEFAAIDHAAPGVEALT
ncbi:MAG: YceD family protein, partial [Albidovulum sp.]